MPKVYWIGKANKKRTVGSDSDKIIRVMSYIGSGYNAAQYQTLKLKRGICGQRFPDILINICGFKVPIELDGGIHGFNDEISESENTKERNNDYLRDGYLPIIINHEQLRELKISEETFTNCAIILLEPIYRARKRLQLEKIK